MLINSSMVDALKSAASSASTSTPAAGGAAGGPSFGEVMNDFLGEVNASQGRADQMVESLALGEPVDVHQVMLALNEASSAMQLTVQVRNKVLEAYQEVMRIPI